MKKPIYKGFYNIKSDTSKKEATIYIYGVIGGFNWDTWTFENTADQFVKDFKEVEANADTIHIKINSPGGNIHDGLPIYNVINNSEKTVYTYVDGIAYSMAALIALAGEKVHGYANSLFMVHNGITGIFGNAKDLEDEAAILKKYDSALGSIIEEKLGITENAVAEKYLNYKDNFFTSKEAKDEGFFDEVISNKKSSVPDNIQNMNSKELMNHYMKMNIEDLPEPSSPKQNSNSNLNNNMNTKERPNVQAVLELDGPMASNDNGTYLNDAQLDVIESTLANNAAAVATAQEAQQTAETNLAQEQQANTDLSASLNALAEKAGVEKGATNAETITALENRIAELGKQPGEKHTVVKKENNPSTKHDYIDFEASIYQQN